MEDEVASGTALKPVEPSFVQRLAQFFTGASPVQIPVEIVGTTISGKAFSEKTTIEFGTPREVIFASQLPLEFADTFVLKSADGALNVEMKVVAVHYFDGKTTAVAARFQADAPNWVIKER